MSARAEVPHPQRRSVGAHLLLRFLENLLPYRWTRWGIDRLNGLERHAAVFYLHPWEIDPDQPKLAAGALSRFRHYRNLSKTEARLRALLTRFRFGTVRQLLDARGLATDNGSATATLPYLW